MIDADQDVVAGFGLLARTMSDRVLLEVDPSILGRPAAPPASEQAVGSGITLTVQTGTSYDATGDQTLYALVQDLTFDSLGRLVNVSAQRRVVIDVTEAC